MPVQGRPIYIQHLGAIHYKKLEAVTTEERMIKFHVQEYERCARVIMPACSIVAGRHIDQTFAIIDVKGVPHIALPVGSLCAVHRLRLNLISEVLGHFHSAMHFRSTNLGLSCQKSEIAAKLEACPVAGHL